MLKLTLALRGRDSHVELNGADISALLSGISVEADVHGLTRAVLHYRGAAVVEMIGGEVTLVQAPLFVTCSTCHAILAGEPAAPRSVMVAPPAVVPPAEPDPLSGREYCPRCASGPRQPADVEACPDCGYRWAGPPLLRPPEEA